MNTLLDAPEKARTVTEQAPKIPKKKKSKPENPDYYGRGIIELYGYAGKLRDDWKAVYEQLSPNRKLGTDAHIAYLKIAYRVRQELRERDHSAPEYEIEFVELHHQYEEAWKVEWGHIPGYWNWWLPRKKKP